MQFQQNISFDTTKNTEDIVILQESKCSAVYVYFQQITVYSNSINNL